MFDAFLDSLFPPKCGLCKKINKNFLCKDCEIKIDYLKRDKIIKVHNDNFSHLLYGYDYKNEIRNLLLDLKFSDKPELSDTFVKLLLNNKKICRFLKSYDIIIPVPMYKKKKILRGYNQTELIAKKLAKQLCLIYIDGLIKNRNNKVQSSLTASDRKNNVEGVYELKDIQKIMGKKIVLFDDIYTTGSTVAECAKQINKVQVRDIVVLIIAKD